MLVSDWRNDRVQRFDPDGRHKATYGTSGDGDGEFNRPAGITTDTDGNIYVADWGNERVQVLRPDGSFIAKMRGESGISKWGYEYYDANANELRERQNSDMEPELGPMAQGSSREQSANIEKLFWGPTSVKLDDRGQDVRRRKLPLPHTGVPTLVAGRYRLQQPTRACTFWNCVNLVGVSPRNEDSPLPEGEG